MMQQAILHNELDRMHKMDIGDLQDEVRRLKAHLNCATMQSSRRDVPSESSSEEEEWDGQQSVPLGDCPVLAVENQISPVEIPNFDSEQSCASGESARTGGTDTMDPTQMMQAVSISDQSPKEDQDAVVDFAGAGTLIAPMITNQIWNSESRELSVVVSLEPSPPPGCTGIKLDPIVPAAETVASGALAKPGNRKKKKKAKLEKSGGENARRQSYSSVNTIPLAIPGVPGGRRRSQQARNNLFDGDTMGELNAASQRSAVRRPSRTAIAGIPGLSNLQGSGTRGMMDAGTTDLAIKPWPIWYDVCESASMMNEVENSADQIQRKRATVIANMRKMAKSMDFHHVENPETAILKLMQKLVHHPSSPWRLCWVCLGMVLIVYDLIMLPMSVFEDVMSMEDVTAIMSIIIAIFWTSDMCFNFFVGFHVKGGTLEKRLRMTAWHYAHTWFIVDFCLVAIDWSVIIFDAFELGSNDGDGRSSASSARVMKSMRAMRTLRSIRLLRVVKVPQVLQEITMSLGRSEYASLCLGIIKHLFAILIVNHILACLWFAIGKEGSGWVKKYMTEDATWGDLYLTALHWCLAQFTPAPLGIEPQNIGERLFTVIVIVFALITFSSFVSSITNLMTHLRMLKSVEAKQFAKLEHYLHDNHISFHLSLRIRRFLDHSVSEAKRKPHERDVELIQTSLSEPLRIELHYEVHSPHVGKHPFFLNYMHLNLPAMQKLCHTCIRDIHMATDDILFNSGEHAKSIYFVIAGELEYTRTDFKNTLEVGGWCSEMVLWTPWDHRGVMKAKIECSLHGLDCAPFHKVVLETKAGQLEASAYAIEACKILEGNTETEYSDLDGGFFDAAQICGQIFKKVKEEGKASHWMRSQPRKVEPAEDFNRRFSGNFFGKSSVSRPSTGSEGGEVQEGGHEARTGRISIPWITKTNSRDSSKSSTDSSKRSNSK